MILNICINKRTWIISLKTRIWVIVILEANVKFIWIGMYNSIFMTTREYQSKSNNNFCNFAAMHKTISMCNRHFLYRAYIHFQMGKCNLNSTYFYLHYNRQTWGHIQNGNIIQYLLTACENSNSKVIQHNILYVASLHNKAEGL